MKISVIGGGPGGLYFSILTQKALPQAQIDVYERNQADDAFGFGVVFSDETLSEFLTRDPKSYELIRSHFAYWDNLDVARDADVVRVSGNGFCGCSRKTLLQLLQQRCREEGVNLHFGTEIQSVSELSGSDYIVASDGLNSLIRNQFPDEFGTQIRLERNKFVWLGSTRPLDAFTYFFRTTEFGPFVAHTYQYEKGKSTWIFECSPETWEKAGFITEDESGTIAKLSQLFAEELDGHALISNKSHWRQFPTITNRRWSHNNIVLLGDAKATAHYSIGSGTKLAMECAIALSDAIVKNGSDVSAALSQYETLRRNRVEAIQHAAAVSQEWFTNMERYMHQDFHQFAFGVMTRAKKVTYENLALRDKLFTDKVLADFNFDNGNFKASVPAAFNSFKLRGMKVQNRIAMASMSQYSAENGLVDDWHLVHYGARATGGVGLIFTEATAVSKTGRITLGCAGLWSEKQMIAWKRVVDFVHKNSRSKIAVQLAHSGRKGSTKLPLNGHNIPLEKKAWETIAPSALAFNESMPAPREMSEADMHMVTSEFVQAAAYADMAGFDMIEIQMHHGFLLASFLSPLTNLRQDEFGGSVENRLRFPLQVYRSVREVFDENKPISVRISASDWAEGGITESDVLEIAKTFKEAGADIIDVSSGNTVSWQKPAVGRMWQSAFSDLIRNQVQVPTITAGGITDIDQVNTLLLNGRADLVALGKPLLLDPGFVRHAQAYEGFEADDVPNQYRNGVASALSQKKTERKEKEGMKRALKPGGHR